MRSGVLRNAINAFKYNNRYGWRLIFGRVLVGFLEQNRQTFENFDLIVASPTFLVADEERHYDHTRAVILAADEETQGSWPFDVGDPPAVVKTSATTRFVGKTWRQRKEIAETELRAALTVPRREVVRDASILVYDDVFTDGFTLREVARCLRSAGAREVCGVTLTRQPWR
jgi:predicted amidophosphoribosyltransferase